ncbi:MAG: ABC transporter ATP-binding protein [Planctomycetota bacterium]|jgi:ABC-type lipoprotein export system ATPase subunit
MTEAPLAELRGVARRFADVDVLRDIDLEIQAGESVAIVGPSGSGKSTLLNILGGLLPPSTGMVVFEGGDLAAMGADELAVFRNEKIGYVFQDHHLLPQCTALENVLVPTLVRTDAAQRSAAVERARRLLDEVGLGARTDHRPAQLSGGECQRVAVVRALINDPRLLLADEPTGSLDAEATEQIGQLLCKLNEAESVALLTVTHSEKLAERMGRRFELRDGTLVPLETSR